MVFYSFFYLKKAEKIRRGQWKKKQQQMHYNSIKFIRIITYLLVSSNHWVIINRQVTCKR